MNEYLLCLPDGSKACKKARKWAWNKSWEEIYNTCPRGDWLIWLFAKVNPDNLQLLTLVKEHYANTVRNLMENERSIAATATAAADDADDAYAAAVYRSLVQASAEARKNNQHLIADICRQYLSIEIWNIN